MRHVTIADGKMADRELSRARVVDSLSRGGFVSPDAEADVLIAAAGEGVGPLDELVRRRLGGEPLAWITGSVRFCGARIRVRPGVFVPRPHTETLAIRASALLPDDGNCVDLCTGSGAVAVVVMAAHPGGNVVVELGGTQADPVSARLRAPGFEAIRVHRDDDGFDRALEARKASTSSVEGRELRSARGALA